jgi:hypothetical protein
MTPNRLQPALLGGALLGVLSALPIVSIGNMCCCLWVVAGGLVAAYILQQNHPAPITPGDGALVGFMAGMFGAVVYVIVSVPVNLVSGPVQRQMLESVLERQPDLPVQMREALQRMDVGGGWILVNFAFMLVVGMIFATIGGVIGAAIFSRNVPPPAAPPPPGPPPYGDVVPPPRA